MRDPLAPVIEGFDLSGLVNRYSFECEPFFTDKGESATMLDGSTIHDVFPLKARYSWVLNSLSARQYAALHAALRDTVSAQIFDPTINAVRVARFHVTRPTFVYNFVTQDYMSTAGSTLILEDTAPRTLSAAPFTRTAATPRDPLAPIIERYDLSGIVNRYSLQCEPFTTDGGNGGTLQDGSTIQDVLATKFRLSWTINAISARQYADLCAVLSAGTVPDTVSASVYNPILSAGYTTTFHVTFPAFRFALDNGQCMAYADSALILTETSAKRGLPVAGDDDWTLFDDGTLSLDPLPDEGDEAARWRRILDELDAPTEYPNRPIENVDRVQLNPGVPSLPSGVLDQFPNLDDVVIPPDVEIDPDAFDNCPGLTVIKIVSFPYRAYYTVGDALDYAGLSVIEISGGTQRNITLDCVLIPAEGYTIIEAGDIMVDVRYHDKSLGTFWLAVRPVIDSGDWWALFEDGTLYIYCVGDMPNREWGNYTKQIIAVDIADSVTSIGYEAFEWCTKLTSVTIPSSVTSIGYEAFYGCTQLTSVTIPSSVTSIEGSAFARSGLTSVVIPDSVASIGGVAFWSCSNLTNVTLPNRVTNVGMNAFASCHKLTSITIPDGFTIIGERAFASSGLTSVTIPSSVTSIGRYAFNGCTKLTNFYVESDNSYYASEDGVLFNKAKRLLIQYPAGKTEPTYNIPDSVTSIKDRAFSDCSGLTSVTIHGRVNSTSSWFIYCNSLTSVIILEGITIIPASAFYSCYRLSSVTLPSSVTRIDSYAFAECKKLADVYYAGTEAQWNAISFREENGYLRNATIHYNSTGPT